jgi:phenylalanyl-tRNA synthetase beta subunit
MVGYNNLPNTPPQAARSPPSIRAENRRSPFAVRRALLAAWGYQETINFSFVRRTRWEHELAG